MFARTLLFEEYFNGFRLQKWSIKSTEKKRLLGKILKHKVSCKLSEDVMQICSDSFIDLGRPLFWNTSEFANIVLINSCFLCLLVSCITFLFRITCIISCILLHFVIITCCILSHYCYVHYCKYYHICNKRKCNLITVITNFVI